MVSILDTDDEFTRRHTEAPPVDLATRARTLAHARSIQAVLCAAVAERVDDFRLRAGGRTAGLCAVLDAALPSTAAEFDFLAFALDLSPDDLAGLRFGRIDPLALGAPALARLALAFHIPADRFRSLVERDRERMTYGEPFSTARPRDVSDAWSEFSNTLDDGVP